MIGIKTTVSPERKIDFDDLVAFETKSYVGIYDYVSDRYAVIPKADSEMFINFIPQGISSFEELYLYVKDHFEEEICGISENSNYKITLEDSDD